MNSMSQNNRGNMCFGIILIVAPIIALIFGSDEPAMQTDNAALVMTGMIVVGIIMLASSGKKKTQTVSTTTVYQAPIAQTISAPPAYCSHCGAPITLENAQYCASCGKQVISDAKIQYHGFSGH